MTIGQIANYATLGVLALGVFFEITPIKFNPVSMVLGWIGKKMNKEVDEKVEAVTKKVDDLERKSDDNEVYRLRHEILSFANSCQCHQKHTKEEFDHIIDAHGRYMKILDDRKQSNGQITLAYEYIANLYQNCRTNNSFL